MFLVDGNVLSEATKEFAKQSVTDWLEINETELAVNPITLGEVEYGILRLPAGRRRTRLLAWFTQGIAHLPIFPLDRETGRFWAELVARLGRKGREMPVTDSLIAATALQHQLTIATRNTRDFQFTGARVVNPFEP
jgi:toxin FitB